MLLADLLPCKLQKILLLMKILDGYRLAIDSTMKRKRSSISRKPRANYDALFQSFSGWSSHAEPFRKHAENENLRDTVVASDGLATDYRPTKLKLKFGGVTHTIHAKSKTETGSIRATGQNINVVHEHVRKSKRITKRYALDVGFSDEDNVNAELHFLEKSNASKRAVSHPKGNRGGSIKDGKNNFNSEKKYEDQDYAEEDPTSSDESILEGEKPKRESDNLLVRRKQRVLINRNGSVDSFKDVLSRADANIIDTSGNMVTTLSKSEIYLFFIFFYLLVLFWLLYHLYPHL